MVIIHIINTVRKQEAIGLAETRRRNIISMGKKSVLTKQTQVVLLLLMTNMGKKRVLSKPILPEEQHNMTNTEIVSELLNKLSIRN